MLDPITYGAATSYTDELANSLGSLKGAPCTIKSITYTNTEAIVEFEWTGNDGTVQNDTMIIDKVTVDNVVSADSENAISSKAVKEYVDSNVSTIVEEQINNQLEDTIKETVDEAVADAMSGSSGSSDVDSEIDSWF